MAKLLDNITYECAHGADPLAPVQRACPQTERDVARSPDREIWEASMWRELDGLMKPGQHCWTYVSKCDKPHDAKVYHGGMVRLQGEAPRLRFRRDL